MIASIRLCHENSHSAYHFYDGRLIPSDDSTLAIWIEEIFVALSEMVRGVKDEKQVATPRVYPFNSDVGAKVAGEIIVLNERFRK